MTFLFASPKRRRSLLLLLIIATLFTGQSNVLGKTADGKKLTLYAKSCAMIDGTSGRIIFERDGDTPLSNASTTKILTCILALELGNLNDEVTFSELASNQPEVHLGVESGTKIQLENLLYALMLESYNDCAVAIAEHIGGTVSNFASMMNDKAKKIGCTNSYFVTPNGLDASDELSAHHSTALDLCKIMRYCCFQSDKSERFATITQTRNYSLVTSDGRAFSLVNRNALLDSVDGLVSGKTGYTSKAGYCYVCAYEKDGKQFCIALLGCGWPEHKNYKWEDTKKLITYGMETCKKETFEHPKEYILSLSGAYTGNPVLSKWKKQQNILYTYQSTNTISFLKMENDHIEEKLSMEELCLPIAKGQCLGQNLIYVNEQQIGSFTLCAEKRYDKWSLLSMFQAISKAFFLEK